MQTRPVRASLISGILLAVTITACGGDEELDEGGANALWQKIQSESYQGFARAPGYESAQPTTRAHGETAIVFVNPNVAQALQESGRTTWPEGALLVKDSFKAETHSLVAAMEKQNGAWFFAEWTPSGEAKYAGRMIDVCVKCHTASNDYVRAVTLP